MNAFRRSFFYSLIVISYIELYTPLMRHNVVGVTEVDAQLFSIQWEPALSLSQTNLCMVLCVHTSAL